MCQMGMWLNLVYLCFYSSLSTKHVGFPIMTLKFITRYLSIRPRASLILLNIYYFRFKTFKKGTFKGLFEKRAHCQMPLSWIRLIYDVLKTSDLRRLKDIRFSTFWRHLIYDVLKTSDLRLLDDLCKTTSVEEATSKRRQKKLFFLILYCLKYSEISGKATPVN